jgi:LPS export ABC transporter protein LptC
VNRKALFINTSLFLALGLSLLFIKQFLDLSTNKKDKQSAKSKDAYMLNAFYLRTNENGQQDLLLFSPMVTHYKLQDTSCFLDPKIFIYRNDEEWRVTSKKARGVNGAGTFYLYEDVKVRQLATTKRQGTLLSTQSLTVFPKQNLVATNEFVTIEQPGLTIHSIGLRGDLNTGNLKLLSRTRGQYDPKETANRNDHSLLPTASSSKR